MLEKSIAGSRSGFGCHGGANLPYKLRFILFSSHLKTVVYGSSQTTASDPKCSQFPIERYLTEVRG